MPDPNDHFAKLENKLGKLIDVFKRTREEKRALEAALEKLRKGSKGDSGRVDELERELVALRREREEVRARIEKLVERLDALTSSDSEG